jgi:hypothetical protein
MADAYELVLSVDLRALPDDDLAELRWHVGGGALPAVFPSGYDGWAERFPVGDPADPDCVWEVADPVPLFAARGVAWKVGGVLLGDLVERGDGGFALSVRQEFHPDQLGSVQPVLTWLGRWTLVPPFGYVRWYSSTVIEPLVVVDRRVFLPEEIAAQLPDAL